MSCFVDLFRCRFVSHEALCPYGLFISIFYFMPIWHICPIGILVPNIHRNILTVFIILKIVIFDVGPYDPLVPCVYTVQLLSSCVHFHYLFFYTYGRCRLRQRNLFKNKIKLRFTYYFVYIRYWPAVLIEIVGFNCICFWFSSIYSFYILRGWSLGHWTRSGNCKGYGPCLCLLRRRRSRSTSKGKRTHSGKKKRGLEAWT